jgi:hypothetical protein
MTINQESKSLKLSGRQHILRGASGAKNAVSVPADRPIPVGAIGTMQED